MEEKLKKSNRKIIFGSVVYKSAEKYLKDFFTSLEMQGNVSFSILLLNDDIEIDDLKSIISSYDLHIECIECRNRTPVQLRIELLRQAKSRNADLLILGDCDDYFSNSRVQDIVNVYEDNLEKAFFYNNLVNTNGKSLMPELPETVVRFEDIGEYNFLGLSNTAVNVNKLGYEFIESLEEYHYNIFDWYFYTRILLLGFQGMKVQRCNTIYRLHENNLAGIAEMNPVDIEREIHVKQQHYECLEKYNSYYTLKFQQYQNENQLEILNKQKQHYWWNLTKCKERKK